jgi:multimeric flavodoxin WrbA
MKKQKILVLSGSPRKAASNAIGDYLTKYIEEYGEDTFEVEFISLAKKKIEPCIHCDACIRKNAMKCMVYDDEMNEYGRKFIEADAYVFVSPVYEMGTTPQLSAFFSRLRWNYNVVKDDRYFFLEKLGVAMAIGGARNGGQESVIKIIHDFYNTKGITIVNGGLSVYGGGSVWSDNGKKDIENVDALGVENCRVVTERLCILLEKFAKIK